MPAPLPTIEFPTDLVFPQVIRSLFPQTHTTPIPGIYAWTEASGICAVWSMARDAVFYTTTVTLRVRVPDLPEEIVAKRSISDLALRGARSRQRAEQDALFLVVEAVQGCCGMVAPLLYEHDPRKGHVLTPAHPELPAHPLFDPPGQSPPPFIYMDPCSACGKSFEDFGVVETAVWGGGNLGFLHVRCCEDVGVSPHP